MIITIGVEIIIMSMTMVIIRFMMIIAELEIKTLWTLCWYHITITILLILLLIIMISIIRMMLAVNRSLEQLYYLSCALSLIGRDPAEFYYTQMIVSFDHHHYRHTCTSHNQAHRWLSHLIIIVYRHHHTHIHARTNVQIHTDDCPIWSSSTVIDIITIIDIITHTGTHAHTHPPLTCTHHMTTHTSHITLSAHKNSHTHTHTHARKQAYTHKHKHKETHTISKFRKLVPSVTTISKTIPAHPLNCCIHARIHTPSHKQTHPISKLGN